MEDFKQTNAERAGRALKTLSVHQAQMTLRPEGLCSDTLTDLLTDLRHFCVLAGWGFDRSLAMAQNHFEEERREEQIGAGAAASGG